jgi:hypothetical protein
VNWAFLVIGGLSVGWLLPKRLFPSQLVALRRDPRVVASTAAILCLLIDDRPGRPYATFADPGAAVIFSIIFGDSLALAVQRRWDRTGKCYFCVALLFKFIGQGFFYIRRFDAQTLDLAFLLLAHVLIAIAASGGPRPAEPALRGRAGILESHASLAVIRGFAGTLAVAIALAILNPFFAYPGWNEAVSEYYTLAAARALVPYLFWTMMLTYSSIVYRSTQRSNLSEEPPIDT